MHARKLFKVANSQSTTVDPSWFTVAVQLLVCSFMVYNSIHWCLLGLNIQAIFVCGELSILLLSWHQDEFFLQTRGKECNYDGWTFFVFPLMSSKGLSLPSEYFTWFSRVSSEQEGIFDWRFNIPWFFQHPNWFCQGELRTQRSFWCTNLHSLIFWPSWRLFAFSLLTHG